jgi:hypothetical protein
MNSTTRIALTALTLAGGVGPTTATGQRPDLSGQWTFNTAQSDNPRDMMGGDTTAGGEPHGGGRRGGFGRRGGGGGGGFGGGRGGYGGRRGGGGGAGGGMSDEQRARIRQTMQLAFQAPATLTIAETDSTVTLTPESATALAVYSDGRKIKQTVDGGGDIEIKGRWQGNDFVVERKVSGGGKVTEDYLRSQDGKQLFVIVNVEGVRGRAIEFRRVYDATAS